MASSPGEYRGTTINAGTDTEVADQVRAIDAQFTSPPANTMKADDLPSTPSPYQTYFQPPTADVGLAESAVASKDAYLANIATEADALGKEQEKGAKEQGSVLSRLFQLTTSGKSDAYEKEGVNDLRRDVDTIANEIDSTTRSYDKRLRALDENKEGMFGGGLEIAKMQVSKEKAEHLADLSITLNARTRQLDTARSIVDQKVDAQTEGMRIYLDGLRYFYDKNESKLSDKQRTLLADKIDSADREYQEERDLKTQIGNLQLEAAKNGAPTSVVRAIGQAKDLQAGISTAGSYLQSPTSGSSFDMYTDEDQRSVFMAGLSAAPERTKMVFLNTPPAFRQAYIRNGYGNAEVSPDILIKNLEEWEAQNNSGEEGDVKALVEALRAQQ